MINVLDVYPLVKIFWFEFFFRNYERLLQLLAKKFIFNFMKDFVEQLNLQIGVY